MSEFRSLSQMESCLDIIRQSPASEGTVKMIVSRPTTGDREILENCNLTLQEGLVGDNWHSRGNRHTADGSANPGEQLTIMNSRAISAVAEAEARWPEAGDQFYVDFDLSDSNLPSGTQLEIGSAVIEVTELPHLGCSKFGKRFGKAANQFVNSETGKALNLRGINAKVIKAGAVRKGDTLKKLS